MGSVVGDFGVRFNRCRLGIDVLDRAFSSSLNALRVFVGKCIFTIIDDTSRVDAGLKTLQKISPQLVTLLYRSTLA